MVKFVATYKPPADPADFDDWYTGTHMPLVRKVPGLIGVEVLKFKKNLLGGDLDIYQIVTLNFADMGAFKAAAGSPEWLAIGKDAGGKIGEKGMSAYLTLSELETDFPAPAAV